MSKPVLEVSNLSFAYPPSRERKDALKSEGATSSRNLVLNSVSLVLNEGEILCLLGPSGCGKSTLLDLIGGLAKPSSGTISLRNSAGDRGRIGYIFQQDPLFPWRTVKANLMLARDLKKGIIEQTKIDALLKDYFATFHLDDTILDTYPDQLSGGMRQRVSIIQALMFNPEILLLDEPFSALDFYTKLRLEGEFRTLAKHHKKSTLLVTHDIDEAIAMADRVLIMDGSGSIAKDLAIQLGDDAITPESARGSALFSDYYSQIWSQLKSGIAETRNQ